MSDFAVPADAQHHTRLLPSHLAGNGGRGRYVLLPGDPSRARRLSEMFDGVTVVDNPRNHTAYLGTLPARDGGPPIDVAAVATGMGPGSAEVIVHEVIAAGGRRLLRVGSCGSLSRQVRPGQVVVVSGAVRDEQASRHYAPVELPAVADHRVVAAMSAGARAAGLGADCFVGLCHTKASLFAREFGAGPAGEANRAYQAWLSRAGVIASEMEASVLFILATAMSADGVRSLDGGDQRIQAGCVLAVYGGDDSHMKLDPALVALSEERAAAVVREGLYAWAAADRA